MYVGLYKMEDKYNHKWNIRESSREKKRDFRKRSIALDHHGSQTLHRQCHALFSTPEFRPLTIILCHRMPTAAARRSFTL